MICIVAIAEIPPAVQQVETHLHNQQKRMIQYLDHYGTVLEAWFPLGGRGNTQIFLNDETVLDIAAAHERSAAQIIIRWHLQAQHVCIPGSTNPDHILENSQVFDFELSDEEMERLNALNQNAPFFQGLGGTSEETDEIVQGWAERWDLNIGE